MTRRPRVGITGYHVRGEEGYGGKLRGIDGQGFAAIGHDYINSVWRAGGLPVGIPVLPDESVSELVDQFEALVVTGGEDVNPRLYGDHPDPRLSSLSPERDAFELALIDAALKEKKPLLCICRGIQVLNVYFGGTLYKDNSDFGEKVLTHNFDKVPRWYKAHRVKLLTAQLRQMYGTEEIEVNSFHHQSVRTLGRGLELGAVSEDGIVESIFHPDFPQLLAVQWHPEMMAVTLDEGLIPFRWLVEAVKENTQE